MYIECAVFSLMYIETYYGGYYNVGCLLQCTVFFITMLDVCCNVLWSLLCLEYVAVCIGFITMLD